MDLIYFTAPVGFCLAGADEINQWILANNYKTVQPSQDMLKKRSIRPDM